MLRADLECAWVESAGVERCARTLGVRGSAWVEKAGWERCALIFGACGSKSRAENPALRPMGGESVDFLPKTPSSVKAIGKF
jgi:hypothetical protein